MGILKIGNSVLNFKKNLYSYRKTYETILGYHNARFIAHFKCHGNRNCRIRQINNLLQKLSLTPKRYYGCTSSLMCKKTLDSQKVNDSKEEEKKKSLLDDPEVLAILNNVLKDFEEDLVIKQQEKRANTFNKPKDSDEIPEAEIIQPSFQDKFQRFRDEDASVILDVHELEQLQHASVQESNTEDFSIYHQKSDPVVKLERGATGVFEVETLVEVLRKERAKDICVIQVPEELHYADYLVIVSALSPRHMEALSQFVRKLYKKTKKDTDPFIDIEGKSCPDWHILDMKNIVLHIFQPETRELYDLECLWSVGPQFDDLTQRTPSDDIYDAIMSDTQFWEDMKPLSETSK